MDRRPSDHDAFFRPGKVFRDFRNAHDHAGQRRAGGAGKVHGSDGLLPFDVAAAHRMPGDHPPFQP